MDGWRVDLRGVPCGLRPCRVQNPFRMRDCRERPCVVPRRVKSTCGLIHMWAEICPPHQSLNATNCLQFSSPQKGKPFCKSPFVLRNKTMSGDQYARLTRRLRRRVRANYKDEPQRKIILVMFALRKKGFPLGGSWRRRRLMRGDKSVLFRLFRSLSLIPHTAEFPDPPKGGS